MKITAEIVNGKCPTCEEFTMLVGLTKEYIQMYELWIRSRTICKW